MDWNSLKMFLAIAESGSLSGAAQSLGVNHSTVFRRLQGFESEIGVKLLEKIENKYVLTPMGEEVLQEGRKISEAFDLIDRRVTGADHRPKGVVKITAPYNIVNRYLPHVLSDFHSEYPDIEINLLSSNLDLNLNNRQADIAIRATLSPPEHLVGRKLCEIPWGVYASKAYIDVHGAPKTQKELGKHKLIGASGAMLNIAAFIWLEKNFSESITMRCDELTAMSSFAECGYGFAFLPVDQAREGIVNVLDCSPGKLSDLWLLTHPDLRKVERIKLVMAHLANAFSQGFSGLLQYKGG